MSQEVLLKHDIRCSGNLEVIRLSSASPCRLELIPGIPVFNTFSQRHLTKQMRPGDACGEELYGLVVSLSDHQSWSSAVW